MPSASVPATAKQAHDTRDPRQWGWVEPTVWTERIGGNFACSPVCIDGRLYAVSEGGEAVVVAAAEKFAELGRSTLPEGTSATPAVGEGALYLRTYGKLMALPAAK